MSTFSLPTIRLRCRPRRSRHLASLASPAIRCRNSRPPWRSGRYEINLLVDNSADGGAPVIYEDNPTFANLIGRVEHIAEMGALVTDFGLIRAGALHRANGGYLIIDAVKLLTQPYAYEGLKRALDSRMVRIESLGQALSLVSTVSLEPEPVPLDVKVILTGEPRIYYLLSVLDPEFNDLFKVSVDYGWDMDRSGEGSIAYARLIAGLAAKDELRPFDRRAVARLIEHSARIADDAEKLSLRMGRVADVMREADFWASENGRRVVTTADGPARDRCPRSAGRIACASGRRSRSRAAPC